MHYNPNYNKAAGDQTLRCSRKCFFMNYQNRSVVEVSSSPNCNHTYENTYNLLQRAALHQKLFSRSKGVQRNSKMRLQLKIGEQLFACSATEASALVPTMLLIIARKKDVMVTKGNKRRRS